MQQSEFLKIDSSKLDRVCISLPIGTAWRDPSRHFQQPERVFIHPSHNNIHVWTDTFLNHIAPHYSASTVIPNLYHKCLGRKRAKIKGVGKRQQRPYLAMVGDKKIYNFAKKEHYSCHR